MAQCAATRKDGSPCRANAGASGYCFGHDPALRERQAAGSSAGGRGKRTVERAIKRAPQNLRDLLAKMHEALQETYEGDLDPKIAGAMARLATVILQVHRTAELDERVRMLEEAEDE